MGKIFQEKLISNKNYFSKLILIIHETVDSNCRHLYIWFPICNDCDYSVLTKIFQQTSWVLTSNCSNYLCCSECLLNVNFLMNVILHFLLSSDSVEVTWETATTFHPVSLFNIKSKCVSRFNLVFFWMKDANKWDIIYFLLWVFLYNCIQWHPSSHLNPLNAIYICE